MIDEYIKELAKRFNEKKKKELEDIMCLHGEKYKEELRRIEDDKYRRELEYGDIRRAFTEITSIK